VRQGNYPVASIDVFCNCCHRLEQAKFCVYLRFVSNTEPIAWISHREARAIYLGEDILDEVVRLTQEYTDVLFKLGFKSATYLQISFEVGL
jgi:hypothetical protein